MVGQTILKLYATTIHLILFEEMERRDLWGKGQANFKLRYQTMDHILTLQAIIKDGKAQLFKSLMLFYGLLKGL